MVAAYAVDASRSDAYILQLCAKALAAQRGSSRRDIACALLPARPKHLRWFTLAATAGERDGYLDREALDEQLRLADSPLVAVVFNDRVGEFLFRRRAGTSNVGVATQRSTAEIKGTVGAPRLGDEHAVDWGLRVLYPNEDRRRFLELWSASATVYWLVRSGRPVRPTRTNIDLSDLPAQLLPVLDRFERPLPEEVAATKARYPSATTRKPKGAKRVVAPVHPWTRAMKLVRAGGDREALGVFAAITKADATDELAWEWQAKLHDKLGDLAAAVRAQKRYSALDKEDEVRWYNLACLAARARDLTTALAALRRAIALAPGNADLAKNDADFKALAKSAAFVRLLDKHSVSTAKAKRTR